MTGHATNIPHILDKASGSKLVCYKHMGIHAEMLMKASTMVDSKPLNVTAEVRQLTTVTPITQKLHYSQAFNHPP